jgi:predicted transcriptional regulator
MAAPIGTLRALDDVQLNTQLDLASELFHRINRIIPQTQKVLWVPPECRVRDAVAQMLAHGYSQVPVIEKNEVLGVFSFRSFARGAAARTLDQWAKEKIAPGDLPVDEFLEQFTFARLTEELSSVFDAMDRDNGLLIGTPDSLIGVLTPMDFLRYLHKVASPFVMIWEIELALRALISAALGATIRTAIKRCLLKKYGNEEELPAVLEDMTFDDYQTLVSYGDTWDDFEPLFGGTRTRTGGKLKEIGSIRNDLFHFKRQITVQDHQTLSGHRDWLLSKVKQSEFRRRLEPRS